MWGGLGLCWFGMGVWLVVQGVHGIGVVLYGSGLRVIRSYYCNNLSLKLTIIF